MRLVFALILSSCAAVFVCTVSYASDIKRHLFIPSIQFVESGDNIAFQVNRRIIIRLKRTHVLGRASLNGNRKGNAKRLKLEERKIGKCIAMNQLLGFAPGPSDSLEFLTKDKRIIRAYLGDNCKTKEFHAGAYIEKSKDGKLCRKRDIIHARYGAQCELDRFRLLVPPTS